MIKVGQDIKANKRKSFGLAHFLMYLIIGAAFAFLLTYRSPSEEAVPVDERPEYCKSDFASLVCEYDWEDKIAVAIMYAESNGDPNAIGHEENGTVSFGLLQINEVNLDVCTLAQVADPRGNVACAYKLWDLSDGKEGNSAGDWRLWGTFTDGSWYPIYISLGLGNAQ
jgi:hypothetical protein